MNLIVTGVKRKQMRIFRHGHYPSPKGGIVSSHHHTRVDTAALERSYSIYMYLSYMKYMYMKGAAVVDIAA